MSSDTSYNYMAVLLEWHKTESGSKATVLKVWEVQSHHFVTITPKPTLCRGSSTYLDHICSSTRSFEIMFKTILTRLS